MDIVEKTAYDADIVNQIIGDVDDEIEVDLDDTDLVRVSIEKMVQDAILKGFDPEKMEELCKMCWRYKDIFRVKLKADAPAKVTPLKMHRKQGVRPYIYKPRKYSAEMREFLNQFIHDSESLGYIRRNPSSRWPSPAMVLPNAGGKGLRVVVDLRGVNLCLEPNAWPMPLLEVVLSSLGGSKCFALLYAFKGYWQFPVDEDSQEMLCFMTDRGIYTSTRIIQGCIDGVHCSQTGMAEALAELLYTCDLLWVDDILMYSKSCAEHVENLGKVFTKMEARGIKLNAQRCTLYDSRVKWCGRIIDRDGIIFDPEYVQASWRWPLQ